MTRRAPAQLSLFDDRAAAAPGAGGARPAPDDDVAPLIAAEDVDRAARLPSWVRFGTSSWTFPGWGGLVYAGAPSREALLRGGLRAYARQPLLRTVGIDRSYYAPLTGAELEQYAAQLPAGFLAVSKAWDAVTTAVFPRHPRYGPLAGAPNPRFLDPVYFTERVLSAYEGAFAPFTGPFVVEIPPIPAGSAFDASAFPRRLDSFLAGLPRRFRYAVELRNRELFTRRYLHALRRQGAAHVLNFWSFMPPLGQQLAVLPADVTPFWVVRLLLPPGTQYEAQRERFAPFRELRDVQLAMRRDVVSITRAAAVRGGADLFVLVNNKAEGSSPLTVRALAELVADALAAG
mgnify:CR=1 FL=1